ncbi:hypothetical protein EGYY_22950 [Eggerthella sp. YY7918]|nr:hypothetical protein EGYY_22950 [Eggerthella sp. YY7918]
MRDTTKVKAVEVSVVFITCKAVSFLDEGIVGALRQQLVINN